VCGSPCNVPSLLEEKKEYEKARKREGGKEGRGEGGKREAIET
jgi:hypothetical protein